MSVYSSNGVFSSSAATPKITRAPALSFSNDDRSEIIHRVGVIRGSKVLTMMPAAVAGQVLALTLIGGFLLTTLIFGGAVTGDVVLSIVLIVAGIVLILRARP
jgi:hypothetical protein